MRTRMISLWEKYSATARLTSCYLWTMTGSWIPIVWRTRAPRTTTRTEDETISKTRVSPETKHSSMRTWRAVVVVAGPSIPTIWRRRRMARPNKMSQAFLHQSSTWPTATWRSKRRRTRTWRMMKKLRQIAGLLALHTILTAIRRRRTSSYSRTGVSLPRIAFRLSKYRTQIHRIQTKRATFKTRCSVFKRRTRAP